jgi:hypothetical protein
VSDREPLPALVLRCRPVWRLVYLGSALLLLALGAAVLAGRISDPRRPWIAAWGPPVLILAGAGCAYFSARYCLARLVLDDRGFRLEGVLGSREVVWSEVVRFERRAARGGPAILWIVHGPERRRLSIPLVYEDGHLLELGLMQGGFPRF